MVKSSRKNLQWVILLILLLGFLSLLTWANYSYSRSNPGGNDFLVHWMGTRVFVTEGISPYSDEAALRIQEAAYGHAAKPGEHELRVAYPLYSIVLFLPFALIPDFSLARALWMTLLESGLILLTVVSLRLTNWRPRMPILVAYFLFSILWYHGMRPLINGNAVILVALGFAGALLALRFKADELAGVLMAFTSIKPQLSLVFTLFLIVFAISRKRWKFIFWLFGSIFLLVLASMLLLPDWIMQNLREVLRYPGYNPPGTLQAALKVWFPGFGERLGWGVSGLLAFLLLLEWRLVHKMEFRGLLWCACLTLVISQWIGIQTDPGNFIILFPALTLVFSIWDERLQRGGEAFIIVSMVVLFAGIWLLFLTTVELGYQPQQSPVMFLPLPAFLLLGLYWIRWWAIRPEKVFYDWISSQNTQPRR